jgi:hypothetical protein
MTGSAAQADIVGEFSGPWRSLSNLRPSPLTM